MEIWENRMKPEWLPDYSMQLSFFIWTYKICLSIWRLKSWHLNTLYVKFKYLGELLSSKILAEIQLFRCRGKSVYHKDNSASLWIIELYLRGKNLLFNSEEVILVYGVNDLPFLKEIKISREYDLFDKGPNSISAKCM